MLGFIKLLVVKVPEIHYMTIELMEAVLKELVRKLSHTRIQEYLDSYTQRTVASKVRATVFCCYQTNYVKIFPSNETSP